MNKIASIESPQNRGGPRNIASLSYSRQGSSKFTQKNTKSNSLLQTLSSPKSQSKNVEELLLKIYELHRHLNVIIDHTDKKDDQANEKEHKIYTSSLKSISNNLQKEIDKIKKYIEDINSKTNTIKNMHQIKEFEHSNNCIDYSKNETKKLSMNNENNNANIKLIQELKQKQRELEDEREILMEELWIVKRECNSLKNECSKLKDENNALKIKNQKFEKDILCTGSKYIDGNHHHFMNAGNMKNINYITNKNKKYDTSKTYLQETDSTCMSQQCCSPKMSNMSHNINIEKIIQEYISKYRNVNNNRLIEELTSYIQNIELAKNTLIDKLKKLLQKERDEKVKLNEYISRTLTKINHYEMLFVDCVNVVKNNIINKRHILISKNNNSNTSVNTSVSPKNNNIQNDGFEDYIKLFTDMDKSKILELFVMNEKVMLYMYELIFPNKKFKLNELLKPAIEKINNELQEQEQEQEENLSNNYDVSINHNDEKLQGDKTDFTQSYHFENLMMLLKPKCELKNIISAPTSTKHSRQTSTDFINQFY